MHLALYITCGTKFILMKKSISKILISVALSIITINTYGQQIITENGRTYKLHIVEKGEGLYRLSINNNVSQEDIIASNPELKEKGMQVGMTIRIPIIATPQNTNNTSHIVAKGETAYSIAKQYGMSLTELYELNPTAMSGISEGQILKINQTKTSEYRLHVVQQGETLYSIGAKYGVKAIEIVETNPSLDINAIPIGTIIRIPHTDIPADDNFFIYHRIATGETLYALTARYNVPQDKIVEANSNINWQTLQVGQIVAIPKNDVYTITYTSHVVERKETLFSITKKYEISAEQLADANPNTDVYALQRGQILRIPHFEAAQYASPATNNPTYIGDATDVVNAEQYNYNKLGKPTIDVALMLPFDAENEMYRLRQARQSNSTHNFKTYRYLEFYQGVRMAADSLLNKGTNIKLHVFDTSNKMTLATISQMTNPEIDLIIGPAKVDEMRSIAQMAKANHIPMVLPFAQMDSSINDNPYLFQASIIDTVTTNVITDQIVTDCIGKNVILLTCSTRSRLDVIRYERVRQQCQKLGIEYQQITYDPSKSEKLLSMLSTEKENIMLMPTTSESQLNSVIVAIASIIDQKSEAKISLYGIGEWLTFQTIEVEVFHKLNTSIYTTFALNYKDRTTQNIMSKYRKEYFAEPVAFTPFFQKNKGQSGFSEYSLWGFDIANYFITALREKGPEMIRNINNINVDLAQSNFKFAKLSNWGGRVNVGLRKISFTPDNDIIVTNIK